MAASDVDEVDIAKRHKTTLIGSSGFTILLLNGVVSHHIDAFDADGLTAFNYVRNLFTMLASKEAQLTAKL